MQTPVESNCWRIKDDEFIVARDGLKLLIGRDLFDVLGISVTQMLNSIESGMTNNFGTQCPLKARKANQFPKLISCIGRSKIHIVKSKFDKKFQPKHQKGRRVNNEIKKFS